jgi:IS4 transposase
VKDRKAEENAIRDIAYAVEAFYIRSEINDSSEVVAKIRENLEYERVFLEDQEKDWKKIRWLADDRCEVSNRNIVERHLNLEVLLPPRRCCCRNTTSACPSAWTACGTRRTTSSSET